MFVTLRAAAQHAASGTSLRHRSHETDQLWLTLVAATQIAHTVSNSCKPVLLLLTTAQPSVGRPAKGVEPLA